MSAFRDRAERDKLRIAARKKAQSVESIQTAQAALDKARAWYDKRPSCSHAYDKAAARDRVAAAKARAVSVESIKRLSLHLCCQELQADYYENGIRARY